MVRGFHSYVSLLEGTVNIQLNVSEHGVSPNDGRNRCLSGFSPLKRLFWGIPHVQIDTDVLKVAIIWRFSFGKPNRIQHVPLFISGLPCCTTSKDDSENHTNFTMETYLYDWFLVQTSLIQIYGTPNLPLHPSQSHSLHAEPSLREVASHIACTDQDILLGLAVVCHQSGLVQCCPYTLSNVHQSGLVQLVQVGGDTQFF